VAFTSVKDRCLKALEYPGTASLSLDSPETTIGRWQIIREKPSLRQIYDEWYVAVANSLPPGAKPALEVGSGAGFMSDHVKNLVTSDILVLPQLDRVIDACAALPFDDASLRGIAMVNTFHHLPNVEAFLGEAVRCLEPGGIISMIEPWNTRWSRFVYGKLHHEPFDPDATSWLIESSGPLSGANGALPWIVFERDRQRFLRRFPELEIRDVHLIMPIRYLLSGGVSMRALIPSWSFGLVRAVERASRPAMWSLAMFAHVILRRRCVGPYWQEQDVDISS
jgi:SAM-dependent methyltransferase